LTCGIEYYTQQSVVEGSPTMGCDDALEVEEFVVVGDIIDDMSGCQ
jgi:hypothetical protein